MVVCVYSIHRTYVDLVEMRRIARFNEVLNKSLESKDYILEAVDRRKLVNEITDFALALRQLNFAVGIPELLILHLRIWLALDRSLDLEDFLWYFIKAEVRVDGGLLNLKLAQPIGKLQLNKHVFVDSGALTVLKLYEILGDEHALYKIDITSRRYGKFNSAHLI